MRLIATDTHDFSSLRGDGKIYGDKTEYIYRLIAHNSSKLFFMSRPCRFGKSGVIKFTRLSVFSALNNIVDVSQDSEYATMFGCTEEELSANFEEHLREHVRIMGESYEDYRAEMKRWYNGFRFSPDDEWKKLVLWMDFSVPRYATASGYGWNGADAREIDPEGEKALRRAVQAKLGEKVAIQPFDALVNRGDERLSRVLELIGGESSPEYATFLDLCRKSLKPIPYHDIQGTCGRDDECECRSCWVRRGGYNLKRSTNSHE